VSAAVSATWSGVSDELGPDPSTLFQPLSNGPTFEVIGEVAGLLFTIQLQSAAVSDTWASVSDDVRCDPSGTFRALLNGPTFKAISTLVPELFAI
jgi:hypothetical protein